MKNARLVLGATIAFAAACSARTADPRPQVIVAIDTDAPVPRMVDRLRLSILDASLAPLCDECSREVALDASTSWPLTFGMPTSSNGSIAYLHATIFPGGRTASSVPLASTAIDRIVRIDLSPLSSSTTKHLRVLLSLDCAGASPDLDAGTSCVDASDRSAPFADAIVDDGAPSAVGTWHSEVQSGCTLPPGAESGVLDEQICIAGGVFWMGDVRVQGFGRADDAVPEHAVALHPFNVDRYEWSVGRYRAAIDAGFPQGSVPIRGTISFGSILGGAAAPDCNFYVGKKSDPTRDVLPLNCVTADVAASLCDFAGGALITEAQWEWAAGGREQERLYPWGNDPWPCLLAPCADDDFQTSNYGSPVGSRAIDVTLDGVDDMALNVQEWTADDFQPYDARCWSEGSYGVDPRCADAPGDPVFGATQRGGAYAGVQVLGAAAAYRYPVARTSKFYTTGVRCAYPGE